MSRVKLCVTGLGFNVTSCACFKFSVYCLQHVTVARLHLVLRL